MDIPYLDTSALAKWYLNEELSEEVEAYLLSLPRARISSLTVLELRCLLARRRRNREIRVEVELDIRAAFDEDVSQGHLEVVVLEDSHVVEAARLLDRLRDHPLRTLDALHLTIARSTSPALATADRVMAAAAAALGLEVQAFLSPGEWRGSP